MNYYDRLQQNAGRSHYLALGLQAAGALLSYGIGITDKGPVVVGCNPGHGIDEAIRDLQECLRYLDTMRFEDRFVVLRDMAASVDTDLGRQPIQVEPDPASSPSDHPGVSNGFLPVDTILNEYLIPAADIFRDHMRGDLMDGFYVHTCIRSIAAVLWARHMKESGSTVGLQITAVLGVVAPNSLPLFPDSINAMINP